MAGGKSDYLEKKVLDHVLGGGGSGAGFSNFTAPVTVYIGLFTDATTPGDTGGTEVTGGSYGRVSVTNNVANWPNASGATATKNNANPVTFVAASASWGNITHFGIFDAATTGNLLYWGPLSSTKTIGNGDTASFAASALTITED